ncbi:MAG: sugar-binding domain-containing protein, partial [Chitinophagales bacterium]
MPKTALTKEGWFKYFFGCYTQIVKRFYVVLIMSLTAVNGFAQTSSQRIIDFNKNWKFFLGTDSAAINEDYNDSKWRTLNLPHDWSIESNFSKEFPATSQGGALPGGIGWYRKTFVLPYEIGSRKLLVEFDGVYQKSEVWINGNYLGKWPNGYTSFRYELTKYIKTAPGKNVIVVKVDNSQQPNSRWYTGSGIYRNVKLISPGFFFSDQYSVFITTPVVKKDSAIIIVTGTRADESDHFVRSRLRVSVYSGEGKKVYSTTSEPGPSLGQGKFIKKIKIANPKLWSTDHPNLYTIKIETLNRAGIATLEYSSVFGIRQFNFDSKKGFFLNDNPVKIKGVCMHHDLGALGAAFNKAAARRQLRILKDMGCNAIRTAHNPPASEFLDLCDQMGFLVMDEAFDMWQKRKNRFDYHLDFKEWHQRDLESMVLR